jgi:hypothetical protein
MIKLSANGLNLFVRCEASEKRIRDELVEADIVSELENFLPDAETPYKRPR